MRTTRSALPEPVRGLVLLLSLLLWSPALGPLLAGEMSVDTAGLRYAAALLLSWMGCGALVGLIRAYSQDAPALAAQSGSAAIDQGQAGVDALSPAPPEEDDRTPADDTAVPVGRRADDPGE